ncbi:hydroxyacid dehydrogenase [Microbacterium saperdae]|uniref:Phosphoglycerate dehydrogenase-like enzyme n=1 Tax=Microbacterium saperdae TaxID=69368 RepID=A0A543BBB6_9MICO|nr:hydroxyacid dehydrogenase [Microbacterium saperdae]TQL82043.1 phosphoglycerate dehydrogenase-like enzyme [Microbacterium saperdae]GGM36738.1 dehydrogenase [Microbacterium saperdae]
MSAPRIIAVVSAELCTEFFSDADLERLHTLAAHLGGSFVRVDRLADAVLEEARIVITSWGIGPFDAATLSALPRLALVAHTGASLKAFVTEELFDRGVVVTQAGAGMARPVAEVSLTFTLALLHRVPEMHNALREGEGWYDAERAGAQHEILGAPIAVIGASRTGRAYLSLIRALGAEPLLVDPTLDPATAAGLGAELVSLDEALRRAQIVAVHAPTLPETHHLIGRRELALMRDGAGLVNTARSWLVDEQALIDELRTGRLSAAIDVFDEEPFAADSPLRSLPGVLLTPHRAAGTAEGRRRQGRIVVDEVAAFAEGRPLAHTIDRDQLSSMA